VHARSWQAKSTTATFIGPITRAAIMSAAAQSFGPIPASNPFATMSPGAASAWTSSWTSGKDDKKRCPDGGDDRRAGEMGHIEAQAPEGMPLFTRMPTSPRSSQKARSLSDPEDLRRLTCDATLGSDHSSSTPSWRRPAK
jgi:hypothetical protein